LPILFLAGYEVYSSNFGGSVPFASFEVHGSTGIIEFLTQYLWPENFDLVGHDIAGIIVQLGKPMYDR
jgi:hypothetical protein